MGTLEYNISRPILYQESIDELYLLENPNRPLPKKAFHSNVFVNPKTFFFKILPILHWLPKYSIDHLQNDVVAGITIAIFNIPQAMAYANLAGLPEVIGLYTSFFSPLFYVPFGTSRHLSMGMVSVVALMTGSSVAKYANEYQSNVSEITKRTDLSNVESLHYLAILTFTTGMILLLMALSQAHFIAAYLSDSVVHGFTTAAAIHTIWSQIPKTSNNIIEQLYHVNYADIIISVSCIFTLLIGNFIINSSFIKCYRVPLSFELLVVILLTLVSKCLNLNKTYDVAIVSNVPTGLPLLQLPDFSLMLHVLPDAIPISIIIYSFSLSVSKLIAKRNQYVVCSRQELFAYALCNIISSFFVCHPSAGSLSRTIINSNIRSKSQISSVISASIIFVVIVWMATLLEGLPKCVLSSIIIVALKTVFSQFLELPKLWKHSKIDFWIWLVAFLATIFWDIIEGLTVAIVFAIATILFRLQWPNFIQLHPVKEFDLYVNHCYTTSQMSTKKTILMFCFESPLLFFNQENFKYKFYSMLNALDGEEKVRFVILDASSINQIDMAGTYAILDVLQYLETKNIQLLMACCNDYTLNAIKKHIPPSITIFFPSKHDAFLYADKKLLNEQETGARSEFSLA